jgi:hypothetical protein
VKIEEAKKKAAKMKAQKAAAAQKAARAAAKEAKAIMDAQKDALAKQKKRHAKAAKTALRNKTVVKAHPTSHPTATMVPAVNSAHTSKSTAVKVAHAKHASSSINFYALVAGVIIVVAVGAAVMLHKGGVQAGADLVDDTREERSLLKDDIAASSSETYSLIGEELEPSAKESDSEDETC